MNNKIRTNMTLNAIKGIMSVIFPLITFPYVSRVLGVDNLGRYSFSVSIIMYLLLIAELGVNTYAIREGARIRNNIDDLTRFSSEMFSINMFSTAISYVVFFVLLMIPGLQDYKSLLLILSIQIVFKTLGVDWLYAIFEDYCFTTIRYTLFQIISVALVFLLVKDRNDLYTFSFVSVISSVGSGIVSIIHSRKYCRICFLPRFEWRKHLSQVLILFAMAATVTVYVSSDITVLGMLCGDYTVGIYSVSSKVYSIIKTILSSVIVVSIPKLSACLGENNTNSFRKIADDTYKTLVTIVMPAIVGIIVLRKEIILLISSSDYISAVYSLTLLSLALFFCMGAWFWGQCILVPCKHEKVVFKITVVSALINIILNFLLIPFWKENAAAITTVFSEGFAFVCCAVAGRKEIRFEGMGIHYLKVITGCLFVAVVGVIIHAQKFNYLANVAITVPAAIIVYAIVETILKNESLVKHCL